MAKKHRAKRQNYVDFLRQTEKEREEYLEKRKTGKRQRDDVAQEEALELKHNIENNQTGTVSKDDDERLGASRKKKHRVEAPKQS